MRNIAPEDTAELEALEQREWRESLDYVIQQGDRGRVHGCSPAPPPRPHERRRAAVHRRHRLRQHDPSATRRRRSPAARRSSAASRASSAGTRWRWSCAPTATSDGIGGHISTFASAATLYEVGFNHFFRGQGAGRRRRHHLLPGPRLARHLRPRVPRRPALGEKLHNFRHELRRAAACRRIRTRG